MNAAVRKNEIEASLSDRFGSIFERRQKELPEILPTGIDDIDNVLHGFPRGAVTEIHGASSSGRTSLMLSSLAAAMAQEELCAVIDCNDTFDLCSAANAGIDFNRLLWIRCNGNLERAFKAVDLILHSGGFGFIALNLCDVPIKAVRRIISSWWFRFRRAIENTPTALIILTPIAAVGSCASLALELKNEGAVWPSSLSLISDNGYSSVTDRINTNSHLSLVATADLFQPDSRTHSHFLQATRIRLNRERPVQWQVSAINFWPQLR